MAMIRHIGGNLTSAAGGALLFATPFTGDSFQIEPIKVGFRGFIMDVWAQGEKAAGLVQIRSPKMHDDNSGWTSIIVGGQVYPLWPAGFAQEVVEQDILHVLLQEETVAGDVNAVAIQLYYDQATGSDQRLLNVQQVWARQVYNLTVNVPLAPAGVNGDYAGAIVLNGAGTIFNLKPNTDYALLGIMTSLPCLSVTVKGPDTGNVRIGCPGNGLNMSVGRNYFALQSQLYQRAMIPEINSAAAPQTTIEVVCAAVVAGPPALITATLNLVMLRN